MNSQHWDEVPIFWYDFSARPATASVYSEIRKTNVDYYGKYSLGYDTGAQDLAAVNMIAPIRFQTDFGGPFYKILPDATGSGTVAMPVNFRNSHGYNGIIYLLTSYTSATDAHEGALACRSDDYACTAGGDLPADKICAGGSLLSLVRDPDNNFRINIVAENTDGGCWHIVD